MESTAERNSQPDGFHWAARMNEHQTVEVHLGRGSIQVLPGTDGMVRVEARTDNSHRSEITAVSTSSGVKFATSLQLLANRAIIANQAHRHHELRRTEFVILGGITAERPSADSHLAMINGSMTAELAPRKARISMGTSLTERSIPIFL
jgi:hypothetical protein